jgi:hypothetical protein
VVLVVALPAECRLAVVLLGCRLEVDEVTGVIEVAGIEVAIVEVGGLTLPRS